MNPNAAEPPPPPQQQPQQPHRPSTSCDRHPEEHFTGFCPACLCERLALLDPSSSPPTASSSRKPPTSSTATAALKAIFKPPAAPCGGGPSSRGGFFPELRRAKSFSASKNEGFSGLWEPQRKSCDVRVRNTLCSLFNQDDDKKEAKRPEISESEPKNLGASSSSAAAPVQAPPLLESKEEGDSESENEEENNKDEGDKGGEIEIVEEEPNVIGSQAAIERKVEEEIVEELEPEVAPEEELKPMKDHIDLDSQTKKRDLKEIAGSFWSAASVFSKKLQKWRQKQKLKKQRNGGESARLPVEKPIGRQYRETQSEIADYGFGRRSCDTDPRFSLDAGRMSFDAARMSFEASRMSLDAGRMSLDAGRMSLDAGRMSFDDPRYSFEEPRASWDGYLIGRTFQRMPTMVSVVEDDAPVHVSRIDTQIPVEEPMNSLNEGESVPGGSAQTRDYYSDSSSRRRKSLDRSNSIRKTASAVVAEMDEMKSVSNAKVSPAVADYIHGPRLVPLDRDLRDSNSNSLRDDYSDTFEIGFRDNVSVIGNGDRKGPKKARKWGKAWNILAFIYRKSGNKDEGEDRYSRTNGNGVERSYSESWQELRGERNGEARGGFNPKLLRSNSSVSWRTAGSFGAPVGIARRNGTEANMNGKKGRDEIVLERNRSARYSPSNTDNGMLRLYLTPMRNSRRVASGKSRPPSQAHSIARSVLRMY